MSLFKVSSKIKIVFANTQVTWPGFRLRIVTNSPIIEIFPLSNRKLPNLVSTDSITITFGTCIGSSCQCHQAKTFHIRKQMGLFVYRPMEPLLSF